MESSIALNLAQSFYIAYYGRPGDPSGLIYWSAQIASSGGLLQIRDNFGESAEFNDRFGTMTNVELVNNLYQQMFSRDAEPEGLAFWTEALDQGRSSLASITLEILNASEGSDVQAFQNKLEAANYFTASLDTESELQAYQGDNVDTAAMLMLQVNENAATLDRFKNIVDGANGEPGSGENPDNTLEEIADETPLPPPNEDNGTAAPPVDDNTTLGDELDGVGDTLSGIVGSTGNTFGDNLGGITDDTGGLLDAVVDETGDLVDDLGGVIGNIVDGLLGTEQTSDSDNSNTDNGLLDGIVTGDGGLLGGLFEEEGGTQQSSINITNELLSNIVGISDNDSDNLLIL